MPNIAINAINLRSGGGLQIAGGLLSRFSDSNTYEVLWNDEMTRDRIMALAGQRDNVTYVRATAYKSNAKAFAWQMLRLPAYLQSRGTDVVFSINQHLPAGGIPQVVYHMNVLRFQRPTEPIWKSGEVADRLRDWRATVALETADRNVFESRYLAEIAAERAAIRNKQIVYIGLDERALKTKAAATGNPEPFILAVTSPAPHKDNGVLIRMLGALVREQPGMAWRLKIAGGAKGRDSFPDLVALAEDEKVTDRVDFLGYQSHAELASLGSRALCLVTASRVESFCMVALEAMSWGCPAIVANATAMPESVEDAALVAEPGDVGGFARHVLSLHQDRALRSEMIRRGTELASRRTWSSAAAQFEAVFSDLTRTVYS